MDNHLEPDALIEDALKQYPLAPMPRDITASVMARIQVEKRPALVTWNDLAVVLVLVVTAGAFFLAVQNLPPIAVTKLRMQSILLYQGFVVNSRWLVPAVLLGVAVFFSALTIPYVRRELAN